MPASAGTHAGLSGSFIIASLDGKPYVMYVDAVEGMMIERSARVRKAGLTFDLVRSDALTRNDSRDLFRQLRMAQIRL